MTNMETVLSDIAAVLRDFKNTSEEIGEIRATLIANFGPFSKSMQLYGFCLGGNRSFGENIAHGVCPDDSTLTLLVRVLEELIKRRLT